MFWAEGNIAAEVGTYGDRAWYSSNRQELPGAIGASALIQGCLRLHLVGLIMCSELYRLQSFFLLNPLPALDGRLHVLFLDVSFELPLT